ncbi:MAG: TMEM165/GDT1 family protein [Dehalococcoidia bacterium]|nr:TMEM165/GDT1 family protein [Dehalococcoidia bacterium]
MPAFLTSAAISAALVSITELGDKSQLVSLWFSTRYRWRLVLGGVAVAAAILQALAVGVGKAFDEALPDRLVMVLSGVAFLGFAAWGLRAEDGDTGRERALPGLGAFGIVVGSFLVSELGDKTQLATVSLAGSQDSAAGVWVGTTVGMVFANGMAIAVGLIAGQRLPHRTIALVASALFAVFGVATLIAAFW